MLLGKIFANPLCRGSTIITSRSILTIRTCIRAGRQQIAADCPSAFADYRGRMAKIEKGPNWEDDLGGEFANWRKTRTSTTSRRRCIASSKHLYDVFAAPVRTLPEPGMWATCPSGAIYKREEDGIVLIARINAVAGVCASPDARTKKSLQLEER